MDFSIHFNNVDYNTNFNDGFSNFDDSYSNNSENYYVDNLQEYMNSPGCRLKIQTYNFYNTPNETKLELEMESRENQEQEQEQDQEQDHEQTDEEYKPITKRKYVRKVKINNNNGKKKINKSFSSQEPETNIDYRALYNRESARRCRLRKKEYILGLEERIIELTTENKTLKELIARKLTK